MQAHTDSPPRPGLALGLYPERSAPRPSRLDTLVENAGARLASRWKSRASNFSDITARIAEAGRSFESMPEDVFQMIISGLRIRLATDGWNEELAVQAFAVVREMSGRVLGMRHFDSQLIGGWVIFNGKLAEMQTGEGKTLTATLPASTAAMAGVPVHVITANDYLASRDAEIMRPLYEALGLSVGVIEEDMDFDARRAAYACDITYCTNKQVAFDYLRDRVERGASSSKLHLDLEQIYDDPARCKRLMLRGLCYAIVDEADSVLVDEARTPLVLSRTLDGDEATNESYREAMALAGQLTQGEHFHVRPRERIVILTDSGSERLGELAEGMGELWRAVRRREELVKQALSALHVFVKDLDYVVRDDKVQIVDGNTGRVMADRSWERGLHQMVEAKEGCELSGNKETLAKISYQRFFRRYLKLSGMTGTAREVESELQQVYGLTMARIPPHRPSRRIAFAEHVFVRAEDANAAVVASAREYQAQGRPVLIGTRSVLMSEHLAELLSQAGLEAQVLNARQDEDEARIIEGAGRAGCITVATNMAGRGTDISLAAEAEDNGGLHVIISERNDSGRVDRQLFGRCARQGDPGSYQMFASLEDEIPALFYSLGMRRLIALLARGANGRFPVWLGSALLNIAQRSLERRHQRARRQLELEDERLNGVLSFSGGAE